MGRNAHHENTRVYHGALNVAPVTMQGKRTYFMGRKEKPDPRDMIRDPHGYPLPLQPVSLDDWDRGDFESHFKKANDNYLRESGSLALSRVVKVLKYDQPAPLSETSQKEAA